MLLSVSNPKTRKGEKFGYRTAILHLAPHDVAVEGKTVCPFSTPACRDGCLYKAGMAAVYRTINEARIRRTKLWWDNREEFLRQLIDVEIPRFLRSTARAGLRPAIRLNGTSDLPWYAIRYNGKTVFEHFPLVQFYDYTKRPPQAWPKLPDNYHLTYSWSEESSDRDLVSALFKRNAPVAVVFRQRPPLTWKGVKVIDGDASDLRFLDGNHIVGLKAKGPAKKDTSGFVVDAR